MSDETEEYDHETEEYDHDADMSAIEEFTMEDMIRIAIASGKSIFCQNKAVSDVIKLTIPELVCSYDATDLKMYDMMIFCYGYVLSQVVKKDSAQYWITIPSIKAGSYGNVTIK